MTRVKKIFALTIALALVFAFCGPTSYALSPRQFGAWVASALTAINITWNSTVGAYNNAMQYFADPFQIIDSRYETIPFTNDRTDEIFSLSTLSIDGDKVTIDGKEYTDIWLSHDAATKFRVNAFDIEDAFDIASQSEGTFVSGYGNVNNVPLYQVGNEIRSQTIQNIETYSEYIIGPWTVKTLGGSIGCRNVTTVNLSTNSSRFPYNCVLNVDPNATNSTALNFTSVPTTNTLSTSYQRNDNYPVNVNPFDIDWVAGSIPAEELEVQDGLHMLVPSNPEQWQDSPATQQTINNINNYFQLNPEFSPDTDIDLTTPGIIDKLDDLFDLISNIIELTKPSFGPKDSQPEPQPPEPQPEPYPDPEPVPYPDPDPEPGTSLPDIDWSDLFKTIKNIYNAIAQGNVISQIIANIANDISNFTDNLKWQVEQLRDQLGDIADKIIHGNKDWFNDIVDSIKSPFIPWINAFKSGVGIWHYVVEWINYITVPFVFFFNTTKEINTSLVLPIYALIAGTIVIAIYRRFGR